METNNCASRLGKFAKFIDVPRKTLTDSIDAKGLSSELQQKLACACGFRLDWLEWIDPSADKHTEADNRNDTHSQFRIKYLEEKRKSSEINLFQSVQQEISLRPVRHQDPLTTDNMLAALQILFSQPGPGEPCPVTFELSCFTIPLDNTSLAVQKGKVQFNCGEAEASSLGERAEKAEDINNQTKSYTIQPGGLRGTPFWIVEANNREIGIVSLPHDLFSLHNITEGEIVSAKFTIYVKDLEFTEDEPNEDLPTYILIRPGRQGLGIARNKILKRLAAMSLPGGDDGWLILCSDQISFITASN